MEKILHLLLAGIFLSGCGGPDPSVETAASAPVSSASEAPRGEKMPAGEIYFEFEGYGPGISHTGGFTDIEISLYTENGRITGFDGVINSGSVMTDIERLTSHLKSEDFFNSGAYPTIQFQSYSIINENDQTVLRGNLSFRGVERETSFPVDVSGNAIESEFMLDTSNHGLSYTGVNDLVRIKFRFGI